MRVRGCEYQTWKNSCQACISSNFQHHMPVTDGDIQRLEKCYEIKSFHKCEQIGLAKRGFERGLTELPGQGLRSLYTSFSAQYMMFFVRGCLSTVMLYLRTWRKGDLRGVF